MDLSISNEGHRYQKMILFLHYVQITYPTKSSISRDTTVPPILYGILPWESLARKFLWCIDRLFLADIIGFVQSLNSMKHLSFGFQDASLLHQSVLNLHMAWYIYYPSHIPLVTSVLEDGVTGTCDQSDTHVDIHWVTSDL